MSDVEKLIAHVRELDTTAAPGPWKADPDWDAVYDAGNFPVASRFVPPEKSNGALIAEYRILAPKLAAMLERALTALRRYDDAQNEHSVYYPWLEAGVALEDIEAMAEGGETQ